MKPDELEERVKFYLMFHKVCSLSELTPEHKFQKINKEERNIAYSVQGIHYEVTHYKPRGYQLRVKSFTSTF